MRFIVQRVAQASVTSSFPSTTTPSETACIGRGLLVLVGMENGDGEMDLQAAAKELIRLRAFEEEPEQKEILLVSQFTLFAANKRGRVSYHRALGAELAKPLFDSFIKVCTELNQEGIVKAGVFGSYMQVHSVNDGPWTICMTSKDGKCSTW